MHPTTKRQLITIAILAGLNILFSNVASGSGQRLNGEFVSAHSASMRRAAVVSCLFGFQFFGFLIGAVVAIVPYRQKPYRERWVTFSLWICIAIHSFFLIAAIVKLITTWL